MSLEFGKLNFSVSFNPTSAFPLDARSYFESYDAAVAAAATAEEAGSSTTTYYYGQTVAVVEGGVATLYTIQPDKTLSEVGPKIELNENVFAHDVDGKLNLLGFADAVAGAQLVKSADGKLSWVKPDTSTVEGLQTAVGQLQTDVETLTSGLETVKGRVDTVETDVQTAQAAADAAQADVDALETTVTEVSGKVDTLVGTDTGKSARTIAAEELAAQLIPEGAKESLDTLKEIADWIQQHPDDASAMNTKITGLESDIAGINTNLDGKVDKVVGSRLMTEAEGTKLAGIAAGAQVNVIDSVDEAQFNVDETKKLTLLDVAMGKVTGLSDALAGKVDKVEGSRLITSEEATKLEGIAAGAEVNVIESVDETQFALDDAKKLTLLDVAMGKVTGLTEALAGKVNAIDGSRLMTEAEGTKLAGIEDGAQVNIIDAVSTEFTVSSDGKELSINAVESSKVTGLAEALAGKVDKVEGKGLSTNDLTDDLLSKLNAAQPNVLEVVKLNGVVVPVVDKAVDITIPVAGEALGLVKSATEENKVSVASDGTMEVNNINVNKLVQTEGEFLILNGGSSK